ncbi:LysR family transcriptional regulator [Variovorax atrisoli]|uniref:LysR family transcriptional regulator n=1 Tax=Variovorax atrisoli TaxID=3394203 RepID=UPI001622AD25|nr:LysR family transcriptional regulator [Variovorax sp. BK613]MBB3643833.1 DNA-binding transcriptional LysR family regulator [Variovorax sp. BK613]
MQVGEAPTQNKVDLLDLNDLRIFTYVAVLYSFSAAADELGISKSSVSRSIVRLETLMGTALLNRTTRKVKLTRAGNVLKDRGVEIMKRIGESIGYVGDLGLAPQGQLTVCFAADAGLEERVQQSVLPRFLERYEGVNVVLRSTTQKAELRSENVDIAISSGPTHPPGSSRFVSLSRWLVASPAYLARRGPVQNSDDLGMHDIIATNDRETHFAPGLGNLFELDVFKDVRPRVNIDDLVGARHLSVQGLGITCLPEHMCRDQVRQGELVRLLEDSEIRSLELNVFYPSKRSAAPVVRAFTELLRASLSFVAESLADKSEVLEAQHAAVAIPPGDASALPELASSPNGEPRSA